jgi:uncharacterized protein (TIGR03083 family)
MPPPADPPHDYISLFLTERSRLTRLLQALSADEWRRPTPCPGWSVLDLTCHLLGDDLGALARHRDGHFGTAPPPGTTAEGFPLWLDSLQDDWVRATRRLSPRLVTDLLAWTGPQLAAAFAAQDPAARTASVSWASRDPVPAWLDHARELSEYWIHRQQLRQALGRPSDLAPDLAAPVLDALRWAWPYRLSLGESSGQSLGPGASLTIEVTGEVARTWHLVATTDGWEYRDSPGRSAVATLTMTTDHAWRLLTNNLPQAAVASLVTAGDESALDILLHTRAIIGTTKWA